MNKRVLIFVAFTTFFLQGTTWASNLPVDSVGTEVRNGKMYVLHQVIPKETVFALSRRYHVTVDQIVKANPSIQSGLSVGQTVYIPRLTPVVPTEAVTTVATTSPVSISTTPKTFTVDANGNKIHKVAPKQTLYAIARLYEVSTDDLIKWNKLATNELTIGEELIVGTGNQPTAAPQYVPEIDDTLDKTKTAPSATPVNVSKTASSPTAPVNSTPTGSAPKTGPVSASTAPVEKTVTGSGAISKITENGLAEIIENRTESSKYLALHKTAPIGTILQVKNVGNGQSVYVRVIGKLPEAEANDKVIVKISSRAYQKLAAANNQFRVEVSYMP